VFADDEQVEARKAAFVDIVDELAERIEALVPGVTAHALHGLYFVEYHVEPGVTDVAQHGQQPGQEGQGGVVVEIALAIRRPLDLLSRE
jgi:hypothetical protein